MSQPVLVLMGLLMFWSYLKWRREHRLKWAAAIGAFAGWAAITRPVDALCFAIPLGVAMLLELRRRRTLRDAAATAIVTCAFASPFLALQIVENVGVTAFGMFARKSVRKP